MFEQAGADIVRIGFRLVHLVDRNDHRNAGGLRVIDGLDRLRHDAIIGGHDEYHDIGHVRAALTHFGKGGVARGIEEGDLLTVLRRDLIAADMLRDTASFAAGNIRAAQRIQQAGLAVVDMAHDRHDRRTRLERFFRILIFRCVDVDISFGHAFDVVTELVDQQLCSVLVDRLVDGDHHVEIEELLD